MNYKLIDMNTYYRKGVFNHFSKDCKCSVSITKHIDVTELYKFSKDTNTKFYINFLYVLAKTLNSRDDYKMSYLYQTDQLICYDKINPCHYIFHDDTETCTPVYTEFFEDYKTFYEHCADDIEKAKATREYMLDAQNHPNWFDASYISWISYDSLNVELPDGYLYFMPIINWSQFEKSADGKYLMPVSVRMNHAAADGYLIAKVFLIIQEQIKQLLAL